jgi:hypothetical protein
MNDTLSPQKVLSQLEDQKCNELMLRLAALNSRRDILVREFEEADIHLTDVRKQRELLSQDTTTALQLSTLEAVRREELDKKNRLMVELEMIPAEEKELRADILVCMNKSKAYTKLLKNEEKLQQKHASHVEQRFIDDLMAHRRIREDQV